MSIWYCLLKRYLSLTYFTVSREVTTQVNPMETDLDYCAWLSANAGFTDSTIVYKLSENEDCNNSEASSADSSYHVKPKQGFVRKINSFLSRLIRNLNGKVKEWLCHAIVWIQHFEFSVICNMIWHKICKQTNSGKLERKLIIVL